jgi:hypothetical protein
MTVTKKAERGSASVKQVVGWRLFGRQVHRFDNSFERDFSGFIQFFDDLGIGRFKEAHAVFFGGYEGAADVSNLLSRGSHFFAEIDGGFLRGSELIHLDSGQITVNHIYGH